MQCYKPLPLYNICINVAVADCVTVCKFCKKEFRVLPNNVLLDFYYKLFSEKRLCLLAVELSELEVFTRMLLVKHKRAKLLKIFQSLIEHGSNVPEKLIQCYEKNLNSDSIPLSEINLGLKLGGFFSEGAWYNYSIKVLKVTEKLCKKEKESVTILKRLLDCYHKRIYAESIFCEFESVEETYRSAENTVSRLKDLNALPNLAGLYSNFSFLALMKSDYDKAYSHSIKALRLLDDDLPPRVIIDVLRQASKSCVMKRRFHQAGLLMNQAVCLGSELYKHDNHPHYSDTLLDYGFYLLNFDSIEESVKVYERSLSIRKEVFEKYNIHIALGHDDLAYALYVHEYITGRFYSARENVDRAIKIMEKILPRDHLLLASAKRVKALILEEIALEMREMHHSVVQTQYLSEAEELHKSALRLSYKAFGEKNVQTAKHYGNLGRLYQSMKLYEDSEKMHLRAIAIKEELLGKNDYEVALSSGHLASLYNYHMKRHRDAEKLYLRSIAINVSLFGEAYSGLQYDYRGIISAYTNLGDVQNVLYYKNKMRQWQKLREEVQPKCQKEELLPLKILIEKFFSME